MQSSTAPLVTIGIPTFNRVGPLVKAIETALAQDYPNLEVIVSDNCSTDGTESFCRQVAERDHRVRYVRHPENRGGVENFRFVLREARGELFMWLGDDDWLDADYVSRCARIMNADRAYSVVAGLAHYYTNGKLVHEGESISLTANSPEQRLLEYYRCVQRNGVFYGLMRRQLISAVATRECLGNDWMMIAALAYLGKVETLAETRVYRSMGVSSEWSSLLAMYKLSRFHQENPYVAIASSVMSDIGWFSPVYAGLNRVGRLALAARAAMVVLRRYHSPRRLVTLIPEALSAAVSGSR
jgi:hypothetical protein